MRHLVALFVMGMASVAIAHEPPQFILAWSEYPSWSAFGVAGNADVKIVDGRAGHQSELEKKYNVDIVLKEASYDACMQMYANRQVHATCITNTDVLKTASSVASVATLPTSTSAGADMIIVGPGINCLHDLKGKKVYGLKGSVAEFNFGRNVEEEGDTAEDYTFTNMDPAAAAMAMQNRQDGIEAIAVWNPYGLQTLNARKDAKVLMCSKRIPKEIVDMVVFSQDAINSPGGDRAARCVSDIFYAINERLADPSTRDDTLIALGEKFANFTLRHMRQCVRQTVFYKTPAEGRAIFNDSEFQSAMSDRVGEYSLRAELIRKMPSVSYDGSPAQLMFTTKYMGN